MTTDPREIIILVQQLYLSGRNSAFSMRQDTRTGQFLDRLDDLYEAIGLATDRNSSKVVHDSEVVVQNPQNLVVKCSFCYGEATEPRKLNGFWYCTKSLSGAVLISCYENEWIYNHSHGYPNEKG